MTFLPIVQRELVTASRRKWTYWLRPLTALIAVAACGLFILISLATPNPSTLGGTLFTFISFYAFAITLLAGAFVTADTISAELREGTIGFLFLTDLRGYDIVLGKFTGRSLNAFYALLAIVPALALPLTLGGVTGQQFWQMTLALVNSLFISLTAGMFVSVHSRDTQRSIVLTLLLMGFLTLLPLLAVAARALKWDEPILNSFANLSPWKPFALALADTAKGFWPALLISNALGWLMLIWTSLVLPRVWRSEFAGKKRRNWLVSFALSSPFQAGFRKRLLDTPPIIWLSGRSGRPWNFLVWSMAALIGIIWLTTSLFSDSNTPVTMFAALISWPFTLLLKILVAVHACRLFADARRSGTLELILTTPLKNSEILQGHWIYLRRIFLWPLVVIATCQVISTVLSVGLSWFELGWEEALGNMIFSGVFLISALKLVADVIAVACLGTYLSLTMKKPGHATGLTVLLVVIIPSMIPCIFGGVLSIALDLIFILWPLSALRGNVRALILQQHVRPMLTKPVR